MTRTASSKKEPAPRRQSERQLAKRERQKKEFGDFLTEEEIVKELGGVEEEEEEERIYCICKGSYDGGFMLACDECDEWYHGRCVGITQAIAKKYKKYVCAACRERGNFEEGNQSNKLDANKIFEFFFLII